ncbi:glucose-6-phosphate isomerase [Veillonella montpellierensis]|nr:glucose-6-phosphate isomerase [Veillonella montpellierensis]
MDYNLTSERTERMSVVELPSGFALDISGIYHDKAVTMSDIERIQSNIDTAVVAAHQMCKTGFVDGHVSKDGVPEKVMFSQLPYIENEGINTTATLQRLKKLGMHAKETIDMVISFGIGGSYLGSKVLFDVQCGEYWNTLSDEARHGYPKILFSGNTASGHSVTQLINYLVHEKSVRSDDFKVMLVVISKSGSTIEPMANFFIVRDALEKVGISYEVIAITDPTEGMEETLLHMIARREEWEIFSVPTGVGGRFSVFSDVGFVIAALIGFDIENFLAGARSMDIACRKKKLFENPALLCAVLKYLSAEVYDRIIEIFMPFGDSFKSLGEWYVQLVAESLGKHREKGRLPYGRTPVAAVGTTDMHAQVQEHQEGRYNKVVQFIKVREWDVDAIVPHVYEEFPKIEAFTGISLNEIMQAALASNQEALNSDNRFNMTIEIPKLNAFHLGEVMFMFFWAIFYEAQLAGVDAFNQPGVEVYKKILGPKLRDIKCSKGIL